MEYCSLVSMGRNDYNKTRDRIMFEVTDEVVKPVPYFKRLDKINCMKGLSIKEDLNVRYPKYK